MITAMKALVYL